MDILRELKETEVPAGKIALCWSGQAGFIIKSSQGEVLAVDQYLSDCGQRMKDFKRFSAKLIDPGDFHPDCCLITHSHFDHLDYDAVPQMGRTGKTMFLTTPSCADILRGMPIDKRRIIAMDYDQTLAAGGFTVTSIEADHGNMVPDSFGFLIETGDHTIYVTGDTCYREDIFEKAARMEPDIIISCINGRFGNLNSREAARAAAMVGASYAVPCHFWTFMQHGGDPQEFCERLSEYAPACRPLLFTQGEIQIV